MEVRSKLIVNVMMFLPRTIYRHEPQPNHPYWRQLLLQSTLHLWKHRMNKCKIELWRPTDCLKEHEHYNRKDKPQASSLKPQTSNLVISLISFSPDSPSSQRACFTQRTRVNIEQLLDNESSAYIYRFRYSFKWYVWHWHYLLVDACTSEDWLCERVRVTVTYTHSRAVCIYVRQEGRGINGALICLLIDR